MTKTKILGYSLEGEMIRVSLDDPDTPEVVYFASKFGGLEALQREIDKKVARVKKDKKEKKDKLDKLKGELDG